MIVYNQFEGGQTSNADMLEGLLKVTPDALGEQGRAIYDEISGELFPKMCERLYGEAESSMNAGNYGEAVANLEKVILMDAGYEEGAALKLLGDAYAGNGEADKARETYEKVVADYAGTDAAGAAQNALNETPAAQNQGDGSGDGGDLSNSDDGSSDGE